MSKPTGQKCGIDCESVACTRARDHLLVTGVEPASEFLDDLRVAR